jgi:hypothetical protein
VLYNQQDKEYEIEEVIQKKGNKCFVKWEGYPNSMNSWMDYKEINTQVLKY